MLINIVKKLIWFKRHLVLRTLTKVPEWIFSKSLLIRPIKSRRHTRVVQWGNIIWDWKVEFRSIELMLLVSGRPGVSEWGVGGRFKLRPTVVTLDRGGQLAVNWSGIFPGGRFFIESEYFIEYKFCFFLSVTVGYRPFGPTNTLKPIDIPDLEGTKPPPPLENTPLVLCTGGGEYTFDFPRGGGERHVDSTVLSIFQKAVTFDHNLTY